MALVITHLPQEGEKKTLGLGAAFCNVFLSQIWRQMSGMCEWRQRVKRGDDSDVELNRLFDARERAQTLPLAITLWLPSTTAGSALSPRLSTSVWTGPLGQRSAHSVSLVSGLDHPLPATAVWSTRTHGKQACECQADGLPGRKVCLTPLNFTAA